MLTALVASALIEGFGLAPPPLACAFADPAEREKVIEIGVTARPSLKDLPGLYRVEFRVDRKVLLGAALPIVSTETRDVLVRGTEDRSVHYSLGFDEAGAAALNILWADDATTPQRELTLVGHCRNVDSYIQSWSAP